VEFNDKAYHTLGYSREELSRLKISDIEASESESETEIEMHMQKVLKEKTDIFH